MKLLLSTLLLTWLFTTSFAQSTLDNALLLDYYQNQRFNDALIYLRSVYTEPVTDKKALSQLAYTSNMAGDLPNAERYYQRIYDTDSANIGVLYSLGGINLRRGNTAKAEVFYKRLAVMDSANYLVFKQLARISADKADYGSNIAYLQKANKLNAAEPDVASDLADRYIDLKLTNQAENVLNKAIAADPENITLLESLVKLVYAQKKWPETISACLKLLASGSESSMVKSKLGVAYYNIKNYQCGAETFADIPGIGQNEFTYYYAAMCYKALKDHKQAIAMLDKAIADGISPAVASYYGEMADSNEKLSRYNKAAQAYQKGLQFSEDPLMWYSLASLYESHLKDRRSAIKYYKKYLASNPPATQKAYVAYAKSQIGQ